LPAWNFATLVDAIARATPDREVIVQGPRRIKWEQLASRARSLAWHLQTGYGLGATDKVAIVLPNSQEYVETFLATRKLHGVPLGSDPGIGAGALHAAIDGSDARVVVCSHAMAQTLRPGIRRIPKRWRPKVLEVGPQYEEGIATATPPAEWDIEAPSADDLIAIAMHDASSATLDPGTTVFPVAPLARGDGFAEVLGVLSGKGKVVFVDSLTFDPHLVWQAVDHEAVDTLILNGDEQARPLLVALPAAVGGRAPVSLRTIRSSDAPLSHDVAVALETALPAVKVAGSIASPEQPSGDAAHLVHPSDVEARLQKHPSVDDCVVLGIADPRIGKVVVAVVQVTPRHHLDASELEAWCRAHVPLALTPGRFVLVEGIDRSASGEVDEHVLRALAIDRLTNDR
jgi:fatty-acyl-CoA synthase